MGRQYREAAWASWTSVSPREALPVHTAPSPGEEEGGEVGPMQTCLRLRDMLGEGVITSPPLQTGAQTWPDERATAPLRPGQCPHSRDRRSPYSGPALEPHNPELWVCLSLAQAFHSWAGWGGLWCVWSSFLRMRHNYLSKPGLASHTARHCVAGLREMLPTSHCVSSVLALPGAHPLRQGGAMCRLLCPGGGPDSTPPRFRGGSGPLPHRGRLSGVCPDSAPRSPSTLRIVLVQPVLLDRPALPASRGLCPRPTAHPDSPISAVVRFALLLGEDEG